MENKALPAGQLSLTLHKQHGLILLKTFILQGFRTFSQAFKDITICEFEQGLQNRRVVYPLGFAFSYDPTGRESRGHRISFVVKGSQ